MFGKESAWVGAWTKRLILHSTKGEPMINVRFANSVRYLPFAIGVRGSFFTTRVKKLPLTPIAKGR